MDLLASEAVVQAIIYLASFVGIGVFVGFVVMFILDDGEFGYGPDSVIGKATAEAKLADMKRKEKQMALKTYRQGDVLIREVAKPEAKGWSEKFEAARGAMKTAGKAVRAGIETLKDAAVSTIPRENGKVILAYGEGTGHMHAIKDKTTEFFQCEDGRRILLVNDEEAKLVHDEHDTITIPKGEYEIVHQREYDPELHSRPVID